MKKLLQQAVYIIEHGRFDDDVVVQAENLRDKLCEEIAKLELVQLSTEPVNFNAGDLPSYDDLTQARNTALDEAAEYLKQHWAYGFAMAVEDLKYKVTST